MQFCSSWAYPAKILIERSNLVAKHITYKATHPFHNLQEYENAQGNSKQKCIVGMSLFSLITSMHA